MSEFLIYCDGLGAEYWVSGSDPQDAKMLLWKGLTDEQRDAISSMECIDVRESQK